MIERILCNLHLQELNVVSFGNEVCRPSHAFGPAVRPYFLIHYILSGKGLFRTQNQEYRPCKGQAFLICPGHVTYYESSTAEPWTYMWIGFEGSRAEALLNNCGLSQNNPIFPGEFHLDVDSCFLSMLGNLASKADSALFLTGKLYEMFSILSYVLCENAKEKRSAAYYAGQAKDYMDTNFCKSIHIEELSAGIGIDRKYLCDVFRRYIGTSPARYMAKVRVAHASKLLKDTDYSIGEIARSVGYEDLFTFSRMFKNNTGISPLAYRKAIAGEALTD